MLSLKLLGGASIERSGLPVLGQAAGGRRLALLTLLARGRPLSRDKILAILWPETDTERGRRLLSDTLYQLGLALGEDVVDDLGDELGLNPERIVSDVGEFERLLDERLPEPAVRVYAGPFLDGFNLADEAEFEEWVDAERERIAHRYTVALEALAEAREAGKQWAAAADWWRKLALMEPGNGRVALRLMTALEAAGDRAGALQHARVHSALLRDQFDAEPDSEVVELTTRLKRESFARISGPTRRLVSPTAAPPPPTEPVPATVEPSLSSEVLGGRRVARRHRVALGLALIGLAIAGAAIAVSLRD